MGSRISFVIFDGFELLDLAGPFEVFQQANRLSGGYDCEVISRVAGPVRSDSALAVHAGYGVVMAEMDANGVQTSRVHDDLGRLVSRRTEGAGEQESAKSESDDGSGQAAYVRGMLRRQE